ncbi:hypothetical protein BDN71DRAFT_1484845 [Pleurotus eryngii]|uniref:Uncharacterized protein n=1 Tax=Pleurotus eryngii TaxID=5323 RepID=A0A9P6D1Y1_PLEER|nr:hypothetical protein BDN71DRAFT_1484845 [Pleurotus eryngii]
MPDSMRVNWEAEDAASDGSDIDEELGLDDLDDEVFIEKLERMLAGEDTNDGEWLPPKEQQKLDAKQERPKVYKTGPDVMAKSDRSIRRLGPKFWAGQSTLDTFICPSSASIPSNPLIISLDSSESEDGNTASQRDSSSPPQSDTDPSLPPGSGSSAAMSEVESFHSGNVSHSIVAMDQVDGASTDEGEEDDVREIEDDLDGPDLDDEDGEAWEEELDEDVGNPQVEIKAELKKNSKRLHLLQINQLMILANFATLRLKGVKQIQASTESTRQWHEGEGHWFTRRVRDLACHYQTFEQLPKERRSGMRMSRSFLNDNDVRSRVLHYLRILPTANVTPAALVKQVNSSIFPELGIKPAKPLSTCAGRQWLYKLGWRHTLVKKGVYMDGHEHDDVVKYRNEVFLPAMKEFEEQMVYFDGPDLVRVEPKLKPGEQEIIALFHDESCFHANEQSNTAWLQLGEQPLCKKSCGQLIHISDFINVITGRLVIVDANGNIKHDARKIIHPESNVIPMSNPIAEFRGKPQAMTLPNGDAKELLALQAKCSPVCPIDSQGQQDDFKNQMSMIETLIRGHECIFLPMFHCELNLIEMYWDKKTFQDAKDIAVKHLNECPIEVIH